MTKSSFEDPNRETPEKLTSEDRAWKSLKHIETCARDSLKYEKLADEDRKILEGGIDRLRSAVEELAKWYIEPLRETKPSMSDHGYGQLWSILGWAFAIGQAGTISKSARKFHECELQNKRRMPRTAVVSRRRDLIRTLPPGIFFNEDGKRHKVLNLIVTINAVLKEKGEPLIKQRTLNGDLKALSIPKKLQR